MVRCRGIIRTDDLSDILRIHHDPRMGLLQRKMSRVSGRRKNVDRSGIPLAVHTGSTDRPIPHCSSSMDHRRYLQRSYGYSEPHRTRCAQRRSGGGDEELFRQVVIRSSSGLQKITTLNGRLYSRLVFLGLTTRRPGRVDKTYYI